MRKTNFGILLALLVIIIYSCSKQNEQALQNAAGNNSCDTSGMTYSLHVRPILQNNCTSCHATGFASGGVVLDTYNGVRAAALNGSLVGSISHANGFVPMPYLGTKLSECTINKVRGWVNRGSLNN